MTSSVTSRELLAEVKKLIPPLLEKFHKGQAGRVAVLGGCEDYTGAPFFSAQAATLLGADMSHVICDQAAATVIKSYSPDLMVHPYMKSSPASPDMVLPRIYDFLPRLHVLVVGPGLGRDSSLQETALAVIKRARQQGLHLVIDADGLQLVQTHPELIHGYSRTILTPNIIEFSRLCKAFEIVSADSTPISPSSNPEVLKAACHALAIKLDGPTVIAKGAVDYIANKFHTLICDMPGGLKRVGGQGDTLSGTAATFLAWKYAYESDVWEHPSDLDDGRAMVLAAYGATSVTRYCSRAAYSKYGRAMLASNLAEMIGQAYTVLFDDDVVVSI
ncbi:Ribokinase-like protein [Lipomyces oligophaga]|uniref:Ribokinase-like protein n=1 Tax=Lipomyces oligophaga TaxID=45792 RepID=UPI0034CEC923